MNVPINAINAVAEFARVSGELIDKRKAAEAQAEQDAEAEREAKQPPPLTDDAAKDRLTGFFASFKRAVTPEAKPRSFADIKRDATEARERVEEAKRELAGVNARIGQLDQELARLGVEFDKAGDDATAEAILKVRARKDKESLHVKRHARIIGGLEAALARFVAEQTAAELVQLDGFANAAERTEEFDPAIEKACRALLEALAKIDSVVLDSRGAIIEASRRRGINAYPLLTGLDATHGIVRARVARALPPGSLSKLAQFLK